MGLSELLQGSSNKIDTIVNDTIILLKPCVVNFVTILLQQVCTRDASITL